MGKVFEKLAMVVSFGLDPAFDFCKFLASENLVLGADHDIWAVNVESVYLEEDEIDEHPYRDAPETKAMRQPLGSEA